MYWNDKALACDGKYPYESYYSAKERIVKQHKRHAIRSLKGRRLEIYRCHYCHYYHVGKGRKDL